MMMIFVIADPDIAENGPVHVEYTLKDAESHDYWREYI